MPVRESHLDSFGLGQMRGFPVCEKKKMGKCPHYPVAFAHDVTPFDLIGVCEFGLMVT